MSLIVEDEDEGMGDGSRHSQCYTCVQRMGCNENIYDATYVEQRHSIFDCGIGKLFGQIAY